MCPLVLMASKDPGPEGPALVHPGEVKCVISFAGSVQVSGFSNRNRPAVSELLMKWTFLLRCWPSVAAKSMLRIRFLLTPET